MDVIALPRDAFVNDVDLIGEWVRMAEEAGSQLDFPVGIVRRGSDEPEWTIYSHAQRDGIGGIMHALEYEGYRIRKFPAFRDTSPPSSLAIRFAVLRAHWQAKALRTHPWRSFTARRGLKHRGHAWFLFTRAQTDALRGFARSQGVTLGTLLFWCANRAIPRDLFADPTAPRTWAMTINMRGMLKLPSEFANLSTGMDVRIPEGASVQELHRTIQREIRLHSHWVRWYWTWRFRTPERLREFYRRRPGFAVRFRTGAFSNVGEFPRDYVEPTERSGDPSNIDAMILGGVTGPIHPFACVPMCWNGRLAVSLCCAAQLVDDLDATKEYLARWMEDVLRNVEPVDGAGLRRAVCAASWDSVCRNSRGSY